MSFLFPFDFHKGDRLDGMTVIAPLGRRQAVAVRDPAFIITPSSTACPPTWLRRQFFGFFSLMAKARRFPYLSCRKTAVPTTIIP